MDISRTIRIVNGHLEGIMYLSAGVNVELMPASVSRQSILPLIIQLLTKEINDFTRNINFE